MAIILINAFVISAIVIVMALVLIMNYYVVNKKVYPWLGYRLQRTPGYSLALKFETQLFNFLYYLLILVALTVLVLIVFFETFILHKVGSSKMTLVPYLIAWASGIYWTYQRFLKMQKTKIGLKGEECVGAQLNELLKDGCRVFHDLVDERRGFNIDHIVVGNTGLYVVETKARTKQKKDGTQKDSTHILCEKESITIVDGSKKYVDNKSVNQVKLNAETLEKMLRQDLLMDIRVVPVLAYVGWKIERTGQHEVKVVSGRYKEFLNIVRGTPELSDKQVILIEQWLARHCEIRSK